MKLYLILREGLTDLVICNLRLVHYEITLILIERLTDSVISNFKMTYGEILAKP